MKKLLLIIMLPILLLGCKGVEENSPAQNKDLEKLVGKQYYLSTMEYPDGQILAYEKDEFTLTIQTESSIVGKIVCRPFIAKMSWEADGHVYMSEFTKSRTPTHCSKPDPLVLENHMLYQISENQNVIILQSTNGLWRATFAEE